MTRTFIVHVPPGYTGASPVPLVVDLHPLTVTAQIWLHATDWSSLADQDGFVVVVAAGLHGLVERRPVLRSGDERGRRRRGLRARDGR